MQTEQVQPAPGVLDGALRQVDALKSRTTFGKPLMVRSQAYADLQNIAIPRLVETRKRWRKLQNSAERVNFGADEQEECGCRQRKLRK
jgi:hypothetical protein